MSETPTAPLGDVDVVADAFAAMTALAATSSTPASAHALWALREKLSDALQYCNLPELVAVEQLVQDPDAFAWTQETIDELADLEVRFEQVKGRAAVAMAGRITALEYARTQAQDPPEPEFESRYLECPVCKDGPVSLRMVDSADRWNEVDTEDGADGNHDDSVLTVGYGGNPDLDDLCWLAECCMTPVDLPAAWSTAVRY
jgi:hypothetical protein